eukprot:Rmarinus@m.7454
MFAFTSTSSYSLEGHRRQSVQPYSVERKISKHVKLQALPVPSPAGILRSRTTLCAKAVQAPTSDLRSEPLVNPSPGLSNADLAPTLASGRIFSVWDLASLWIGIVVCIPTFMLAGSLIDIGMNWWQAIGTIGIANMLVLVPMILNGHPGTKYGVPFPVLARAAFGIRGAHLASLLRGLVGCGWFGIQTWVGGTAMQQIIDAVTGGAFSALAPAVIPVLGITVVEFLCFMMFWLMQMYILFNGMDAIRKVETYAAPFLIVTGVMLLVWAYYAAGGFHPMLNIPHQFGPGGAKEGQALYTFLCALTANFGYWATLSLNIPDFTRYCKSQKDQLLGQVLGLPTCMVLFAVIGVAVTSATVTIFGEPIADPTAILARIGGGAVKTLSLVVLLLATLSTNIAANIIAPTNALINFAPDKFDFSWGALATAGLAIAMMPWKLIASTGGFIFTWLLGYSALLGPIGGIMIADYFILRKTELDMQGLYQKDGPYWYSGGYNPAAMWSLLIGILPNIPGFLRAGGFVSHVPAIFEGIYSQAWLIGFLLAGFVYLRLMDGHESLRPQKKKSL